MGLQLLWNSLLVQSHAEGWREATPIASRRLRRFAAGGTTVKIVVP